MDAPIVPAAKPPTGRLLSAARRVRDYQQEGQGTTRQLDIQLRHTPLSEVFFRVWDIPEDYYAVALLRVKDDQGRSEIYLLSPEVADLPFVAPKVRDGLLVPCITSTGTVFVWAQTIPNPSDRMGYRIHKALERVALRARKEWVSLSWHNSTPFVHDPPAELVEEKPHWPTGQTLEEIFEIAISDRFISDPDHPVIRHLNTKSREA
jgi:hypothetical protein